MFRFWSPFPTDGWPWTLSRVLHNGWKHHGRKSGNSVSFFLFYPTKGSLNRPMEKRSVMQHNSCQITRWFIKQMTPGEAVCHVRRSNSCWVITLFVCLFQVTWWFLVSFLVPGLQLWSACIVCFRLLAWEVAKWSLKNCSRNEICVKENSELRRRITWKHAWQTVASAWNTPHDLRLFLLAGSSISYLCMFVSFQRIIFGRRSYLSCVHTL